MSTLQVDDIVNAAGTGAVNLSQGFSCAANKPWGTFSPRIAETTSANHTLSDTDGIGSLVVNVSSSSYTVTLPTVGDNLHRRITIKRGGSANHGALTIDGEGAETIDDTITTALYSLHDYITVQAGASAWHVVENGMRDRVHETELTTNITVTGEMTELRMNNLIVGRMYRVEFDGHIGFNNSLTQTPIISTVNNGDTIAFGFISQQTSHNSMEKRFYYSNVFTAGSSTLTTHMGGTPGGCSLKGRDSTNDYTRLRLTELNQPFAYATPFS